MSTGTERAKKTVFWGLMVSESLDEIARKEARRRGMNLSEFVRYAVSRFIDDYATQPNGYPEVVETNNNLPYAK